MSPCFEKRVPKTGINGTDGPLELRRIPGPHEGHGSEEPGLRVKTERALPGSV